MVSDSCISTGVKQTKQNIIHGIGIQNMQGIAKKKIQQLYDIQEVLLNAVWLPEYQTPRRKPPHVQLLDHQLRQHVPPTHPIPQWDRPCVDP